MQAGAKFVSYIKMAQIADLAHDCESYADGVATGIPLFEPFK